MKKLLCLFLFINAEIAVKAQPARDSVIAAVNMLFDAMKKADTTLLKNSFSPNAVLQTIKDEGCQPFKGWQPWQVTPEDNPDAASPICG